MEKHPWEKAWSNKTFEIKTLKPSIIVEKHMNKIFPGDAILDVGSGNGRNSIYLASLGCNVDSFDVSDTKWTESLDPGIKDNISFKKSNILDYPYIVDKYKAIVIARVAQYLNRKELTHLLDRVASSLNNDGFLLLSYNSQGGIFDRAEIEVPKFHYAIEDIESMLKDRFKKIEITKGTNINTHVNYEGKIASYDIYATEVLDKYKILA